jgi:hypothetical protein
MDGIVVPLPPMNSAQIPLPAQPNVPASLADITNGAKLLDDLIESKSENLVFEMLSFTDQGSCRARTTPAEGK